MKDGTYALTFSADGYDGAGRFNLLDNRGEGQDGKFRIQGRLIERGGNLTAVVNVLMPPGVAGNARLPAHYSLDMSGSSSEDAFTLIGTGPLGVIVDIGCSWVGPHEAGTT